jgi:hypothetical protein
MVHVCLIHAKMQVNVKKTELMDSDAYAKLAIQAKLAST